MEGLLRTLISLPQRTTLGATQSRDFVATVAAT
jgi:hypothetical protein